VAKLIVAFQNSAFTHKIPNCHIKSEPDIDFRYKLYFDVMWTLFWTDILIFAKEKIRWDKTDQEKCFIIFLQCKITYVAEEW
jgi:hypothetical protein